MLIQPAAGSIPDDSVGIHHTRGDYDLHLNPALRAEIFVLQV